MRSGSRKLTLARETLRRLSAGDLGAVRAAVMEPPTGSIIVSVPPCNLCTSRNSRAESQDGLCPLGPLGG
jgi:hypothetical protein